MGVFSNIATSSIPSISESGTNKWSSPWRDVGTGWSLGDAIRNGWGYGMASSLDDYSTMQGHYDYMERAGHKFR